MKRLSLSIRHGLVRILDRILLKLNRKICSLDRHWPIVALPDGATRCCRCGRGDV